MRSLLTASLLQASFKPKSWHVMLMSRCSRPPFYYRRRLFDSFTLIAYKDHTALIAFLFPFLLSIIDYLARTLQLHGYIISYILHSIRACPTKSTIVFKFFLCPWLAFWPTWSSTYLRQIPRTELNRTIRTRTDLSGRLPEPYRSKPMTHRDWPLDKMIPLALVVSPVWEENPNELVLLNGTKNLNDMTKPHETDALSQRSCRFSFDVWLTFTCWFFCTS